MSAAGAGQLALHVGPLDPRTLAELTAHERAKLYERLELDALERVAAEEAARAILARQYRSESS
jgi:hypothetical protein